MGEAAKRQAKRATDWMEPKHQTRTRLKYYAELELLFLRAKEPPIERLINFSKYVPNNVVSRFLARYELMKCILDVPGVVIECGVLAGFGLFSFAHSSTVLEPYNQTRRIIGFDTFAGFPSVSKIDTAGTSRYLKRGAYKADSYSEILAAGRIHDAFRLVSNDPQIELVRGDIVKTVPRYVKQHSELLVALLFMDCDLYEPTKAALQHLLPLMPQGAIVAFDELNVREFPGETQALKDTVGALSGYRLERLPFSKIAFYRVGKTGMGNGGQP